VILLSSVVVGILENADVFMPQEYLALSIGTPRLGVWISVSEFVPSLDIDVSTFRDGTEECIRGGAEREDSVPRRGLWRSCAIGVRGGRGVVIGCYRVCYIFLVGLCSACLWVLTQTPNEYELRQV